LGQTNQVISLLELDGNFWSMWECESPLSETPRTLSPQHTTPRALVLVPHIRE
jgi:hypothetical protein